MPQNRFLAVLVDRFAQAPGARFCTLVGAAGETAVTWEDFARMCRRFVGAYQARSLVCDDVVLIFLRHGPEMFGAFYGAMLGGFVPSFMPCTSPRQNPSVYWASHAALLAHIRPAAVVADRATFAEMDAAGLDRGRAQEIVIDDLPQSAEGTFVRREGAAVGLLQHSSGTTGLKKGVALSYDAIVAQLESYGRTLRLAHGDAVVSWLPLYHDMGLVACCLLPAYFGVPVTHIDPFHWLAQPDLLLKHLDRDGGTFAWLPNFAFEHLTAICGRQAGKFDLSHVKAFVNCSEPCKPGSFDRFAAAFAPSGVRPGQLQCCYAMAETVFAVSQTALGVPPRRLRVDPASLNRGGRPRVVGAEEDGVELIETGHPIPGMSVRISDEGHGVPPDGTIGEIGISGDFLFSGYYRDPVRTSERLRDGVYSSRDIGFVHDSRVFVLGRADDLIIVNGRNLYAHEIEAALAGIDGLKPGRSVAVGQFDERIGSEALFVICEKRTGCTRSDPDLRSDIQDRILSTFAVVPRKIHLVEEGSLVKTTSGKISRKDNLAEIGRDAELHAG